MSQITIILFPISEMTRESQCILVEAALGMAPDSFRVSRLNAAYGLQVVVHPDGQHRTLGTMESLD